MLINRMVSCYFVVIAAERRLLPEQTRATAITSTTKTDSLANLWRLPLIIRLGQDVDSGSHGLLEVLEG